MKVFSPINQFWRRRKNEISLGKGVSRHLPLRFKFGKDARNNRIKIGKGFKFGKFLLDIRGEDNTVVIGENSRFGGKLIVRGNGVRLEIGSNCHFVNAYVLAQQANLTIGDDCLVSREVIIRNSDVHRVFKLDEMTSERKLQNPSLDMRIGNHVWIGARAFLSKGANIPDHSVVGAASFVNKTFEEPNCVIAGNPAKIVKTNVEWER